uniref:C2 domain-containing protein n=1 Tax=Octactis speculum TaxID=3111310 RepID=A0A7S2G3Q5_9STRA|mmetsp:Transcript_38231/g.51754  ORF Transcript_38231/g.51754 Transcript_38231/m.51754 type:complete len:310 (+) Transcript_38231:35-964(+)
MAALETTLGESDFTEKGCTHVLIIEIDRIRKLKDLSSSFDKIDPYIKIIVGGFEFDTSVHEDCHHADIKERTSIPINEETLSGGVFQLQVWDSNNMKGDAKKAHAEVSLPEAMNPIMQDVDCEPSGTVTLKMLLCPIIEILKMPGKIREMESIILDAEEKIQAMEEADELEEADKALLEEKIAAMEEADEAEEGEQEALKAELQAAQEAIADVQRQADEASEQFKAEQEAREAETQAKISALEAEASDTDDIDILKASYSKLLAEFNNSTQVLEQARKKIQKLESFKEKHDYKKQANKKMKDMKNRFGL